MTKEDKQYVLDALKFALDNGTFENAEHSYNTLANAINVIDNEPTSEGWIKINSEDDLPEKTDSYFVFYPDGNIICHHFSVNSDFDKDLFLNEFTHYQIIQKPQPPIY